MPVSEIDVRELAELDPANVQLIDVREPEEYLQARVPGAKLVPLMSIPGQIGEMDRTRPLYLVCASGVRSMNAAQFLDSQGFDAVNIAGGTKDWVSAGMPYESGPATS